MTALELDLERLQQTRLAASIQQSASRMLSRPLTGSLLAGQRAWPYNSPGGSAPAAGVASAFVEQLKTNRAAHDERMHAASAAAMTGAPAPAASSMGAAPASAPAPRRDVQDSAVQVPGTARHEAGTQMGIDAAVGHKPAQAHAQSQTAPAPGLDAGATASMSPTLPQMLISPPPRQPPQADSLAYVTAEVIAGL